MFHKEGFNLIILFFILVATDVVMLEVLFDESSSLKSILQIFSLIIFVFILWFFRNPKRNIIKNPPEEAQPRRETGRNLFGIVQKIQKI